MSRHDFRKKKKTAEEEERDIKQLFRIQLQMRESSPDLMASHEVAEARKRQGDASRLLSSTLTDSRKTRKSMRTTSSDDDDEPPINWPKVHATYVKPKFALRNPSEMAKEMSNNRLIRFHEEMGFNRHDVKAMLRIDDTMNVETQLRRERQELMERFQNEAKAREATRRKEAREERARRSQTKASNASSYESEPLPEVEEGFKMSIGEAVNTWDRWLSKRLPAFQEGGRKWKAVFEGTDPNAVPTRASRKSLAGSSLQGAATSSEAPMVKRSSLRRPGSVPSKQRVSMKG